MIHGETHREVADEIVDRYYERLAWTVELPKGVNWVKWKVKKDFGGWVLYNVNAPMETMFSAESWQQAFELACKYSRYNWEVNIE